MKKRITIGAAVVSVMLGCLVTFQATYILLQNRFEKKYFDTVANSVSVSITDGNTSTSQSANSSDSSVSNTPSSEFLQRAMTKIAEVDAYYRAYYLYDLDDEKLIDTMIQGYVAGTGDTYGHYYTAEQFQEFIVDEEGEMVGIGISIIYNDYYQVIEVINVMPDSPAMEAGIKVGDLITTVGIGDDAVYVAELGYVAAVSQLQGKEGTQCEFTVRRGENYSEIQEYSLTRAKVTELTVTSHIYDLDSSIGIIKISGFDGKTFEQFKSSVNELTVNGCDKIVVDLRYNPGGELTAIVNVLDYILPEGPIIRIFDGDGNEVNAYYSDPNETNIPMAVLVNGSTASAAELFTSAVKDYKKAIIVGTNTYGKGCMQTTVQLSDGGGLTITYRMYNPPFSDNYHGTGVEPDIIVEMDENAKSYNIYKLPDSEDNQLREACDALLNGN